MYLGSEIGYLIYTIWLTCCDSSSRCKHDVYICYQVIIYDVLFCFTCFIVCLFFIDGNDFLFFSVENSTDVHGETRFQSVLWLIVVAQVIAFLASLFGNSVIIHIIRTDNSMKTITNYLILNQACSDLLISFTELTDAIHTSLTSRLWTGGIFGLITCKIFIVTFFIPLNFSVWILTAIAVDRFYAVARPLKPSPVSQHLKKIILSLCAWSVAFSTPFLTRENFKKIKGSYYCKLTDDWTAVNVIEIFLSIALPLFVIAVLYTIVCFRLWSRKVPGEGANQNAGQAEALKIARKVTGMMIVVVVLYVLCWFPLYILLILSFVGRLQVQQPLFGLFINFLALSYCGVNPYIYVTFSQNFRTRFKKIFGKYLGRSLRIVNVISFRSQSVQLEQI